LVEFDKKTFFSLNMIEKSTSTVENKLTDLNKYLSIANTIKSDKRTVIGMQHKPYTCTCSSSFNSAKKDFSVPLIVDKTPISSSKRDLNGGSYSEYKSQNSSQGGVLGSNSAIHPNSPNSSQSKFFTHVAKISLRNTNRETSLGKAKDKAITITKSPNVSSQPIINTLESNVQSPNGKSGTNTNANTNINTNTNKNNIQRKSSAISIKQQNRTSSEDKLRPPSKNPPKNIAITNIKISNIKEISSPNGLSNPFANHIGNGSVISSKGSGKPISTPTSSALFNKNFNTHNRTDKFYRGKDNVNSFTNLHAATNITSSKVLSSQKSVQNLRKGK
jgi:hypothetical protein